MKDLARNAIPINSGNTTPCDERAASSKDVPDADVDKPSPESLLVKALQSMLNNGDEDGKPKTKAPETIKLLDSPSPEPHYYYRSWRIAARGAIHVASDRPDEALAWV